MTTQTTTRDDDSSTVLPTSAYHLGRDGDGRDHFHDPMSGRVWVFRGGELVHETELKNRSIVVWVQFITEEECGWAERQRVEKVGGLDDLLAGVFEREAEARENGRVA